MQLVGLGTLLVVIGLSASAQAAPVTCDAPGQDFTINIIPDFGTATCFAVPPSTPSNIQGDNDDFPGYTFLDKDQGNLQIFGGGNDSLLSYLGHGNSVGVFALKPTIWSLYDSVLIGFKAGNSWAAFQLTAFALSGTWSVTSDTNRNGPGMSHVNLYASNDVPEVPTPEPASMLLFGTGLVGLAQAARKRRRSNNA
jgi:hypothetical protein